VEADDCIWDRWLNIFVVQLMVTKAFVK